MTTDTLTTKDKIREKFRSLSGEYFFETDILEEMFIPGVVCISYRYLNGKETLTMTEPGILTIHDIDLEADHRKMMASVHYATKTNVGKFFIAIFQDVDCFRVREFPVPLTQFFKDCESWKPLPKVEVPNYDD